MSVNPQREAASQPKAPAPYKPTLFDRRGPDAGVVLRAWMGGVMTFGLFLPVFALINAAGNLFGRFLMGGDNTPYKEQYSREQALVMRGEVDEALRSFEAIIAEKPDAIDPRVKAAELYAKEKGDHRRAAELFREVQRIAPLKPGEDIYATNRLVDLYTGPLADPGRALVELRRLIERHPNSRAATHARTALAALKARVHHAS